MLFRMFSFAILALAPLLSGPTLAADDYTLDGKIVSIADNKLVITCKDDKEQTLMLASDVQMKCDGRTCGYNEMKPGTKVRITTRPDDRQTVIRIEAIIKQVSFDGTHDGKLVSITENTLVMTSRSGKEHSHVLAASAKLMLDGQPCKWNELKPGTKIRVTTKSEDGQSVIRIEAIDKQEVFAGTVDGKFVSYSDNKLVLTDKAGKEQTYTLSTNARLTCDSQVCKFEDLKTGMRVRISMMSDENQLVSRIEALDKKEAFDSLN